MGTGTTVKKKTAAKKAAVKKTVAVKKLTWKTLTNGVLYEGRSGNSKYYFIKNGNEQTPYITGQMYQGSGYLGSMTSYHPVEDLLAEHLTSCIKAQKYKKMPDVGKYILTIGDLKYDAAIEQKGKIVWSESIEPILHLLKEDLPIKLTGVATKKPKTLKDLKKLIV